MINLPPLAQTIVIAALIIGYIGTFLFQKNKIAVLSKTNTALKELTDGQKNHIDAYKQMVNLKDIEQHYNLKIEKAVNETIQTTVNLIKDAGGVESYTIQLQKDLLVEYTFFYLAFLGTKDKKMEWLDNFMPLNAPILRELALEFRPSADLQRFLNKLDNL